MVGHLSLKGLVFKKERVGVSTAVWTEALKAIDDAKREGVIKSRIPI